MNYDYSNGAASGGGLVNAWRVYRSPRGPGVTGHFDGGDMAAEVAPLRLGGDQK